MRITCNRNADIRELMHNEGVGCWRLAEIFGVCENTIARRLRSELSESEKTKYIEAVRKAKKNIEEENF